MVSVLAIVGVVIGGILAVLMIWLISVVAGNNDLSFGIGATLFVFFAIGAGVFIGSIVTIVKQLKELRN